MPPLPPGPPGPQWCGQWSALVHSPVRIPSMGLVRKTARPARARCARPPRVRLEVETLETRIVPYSVSGYSWPHPELVTLSFVPDGTVVGTTSSGQPITSNLFATFNAQFGSAAVWQNEILKAAQVWAAQTNVNFA